MKSHVFSTQPHKLNKFKTALITSLLICLTACGGNKDEQKAPPANATSQNTSSQSTSKAPTSNTETSTAEATDKKVADKVEKDTTTNNEKNAEPKEQQADKPTSEGETATKSETPALSADAGQKLYDKTCKTCHATGLLNAPKMGDKNAWQARIAKGKETLYKHSAKGFNKMPPQAVGDVSEAQVHAAVDYMIEKSS